MKGFAIPLLSVIFVTLIVGSTESVVADHISLGGQGIFKDENNVNITPSKDSKYLIHLQVVVRDQGQLVSVSEAKHGSFIPHEVTDHVFDTLLGKKEIIMIDKIRYEKVEYTVSDVATSVSMHDQLSFWSIEFCIKTKEHSNADQREASGAFHLLYGTACIPIFQTITPHISLGENDIFTLHWTILREIN